MAGATFVVLTLFAGLYTEVPWWVAAWTALCGTMLVASGMWAWQRPQDVVGARYLGASFAIAGAGASLAALRLTTREAVGPVGALGDLEALGIGIGIVCACYLSFIAADLVRSVLASRMRRGQARRVPNR